ncbi:MAG: hypothetical protein IPN54_06880 [Bacteroidetes bacterium]|nr:hypothetical protein [Bacteroidota bacterium]
MKPALKRIFFVIICTFIAATSKAQTAEDSLVTGLTKGDGATVISGYGEFKFNYDLRYETGTANMTRAVLFVGHRFNNRVSLVSELELEDAKIEGGEAGGEFNLEQLYLRFNLNASHYLTAGLFIPRIGIINENHLPTTFNGNDRPYTEKLVIPSTWREMGIGFYGTSSRLTGLSYSAALINGLNASEFESESGIRAGRQGGRMATATNLAITGSLVYNTGDLRAGISAYYGGSTGLSQREADSLLLDNGAFSTPVILTEANIIYSKPLFTLKTLGAIISIPDAKKLNRAYAGNTASMMFGGYFEAGINLLHAFNYKGDQKLDLFARAEIINLNAELPDNGISNEINEKTFFITGLQYFPAKGVVIKADYTLRNTGEPNSDLIINPFPEALPYYKSNGFFNIGAGYSF